MSIFKKYDQSTGKKKLKPWAKWAIGVTLAGAMTFAVNHYTGNNLGLESKVSNFYQIPFDAMVESIAKQDHITNPQALKIVLSALYYSNEPDSKLEQAANGYYANREEDKLYRYWVLVKVNGKDVQYPIYFKPGVVDNTHTEQRIVILGEKYAVEGASAITGVVEKAQSQQQGSNPNSTSTQLLRALR